MKFTDEQQAVIEHQSDAVVNAVAGSGKTSTLVGYAKARPDQRLLYLAFNRSVREEALSKYAEKGCFNVTVETAHSLAYRGLDVRRRFAGLHPTGALRTFDIVDLCGLKPSRALGPQHHLVMARHVQKLMALFCNSAEERMDQVDYLASVTDAKAQTFVLKHQGEIYGHARDLLARMFRSQIPVITHDAYLKFYQLSKPQLPYDGILFDEGQDAAPAMLDIFLRQKATRVIVGDTHQQIYGFRQAVNSLAKVRFPAFNLGTSFRFRQEVADLAMKALNLKKKLGRYSKPVQIIGAGNPTELETRAVISRSNLRLLKAAMDGMIKQGLKRLHFEGDLNNYTYMSEGASLYDVLYLRLDRREKIRNPLIKSFGDFVELQEYITAAEDAELALMVEIVSTYGPALFDYLKRLRELQVPKRDAEMIYSTVHKAKGQEYDQVELTEGFLEGEKLGTIIQQAYQKKKKLSEADKDSLAEEINILYVALTRVRNHLLLPFEVESGTAEADYFIYNGKSTVAPGEKSIAAI